MARDGVRSSTPKSREPHEQNEEAAAKATQQHSGPEGHQKEKSSSNGDNATDVSKVTEVSDKEQSRKDWEIIKTLLPNVWPKNDWGTKTRVLLAVGLLVGGKVSTDLPNLDQCPVAHSDGILQLLNVQVPFFFKDIIDTMNIPIDPTTSNGVLSIAGTVIVGCKSKSATCVEVL
jgi:ABC transporter ATM